MKHKPLLDFSEYDDRIKVLPPKPLDWYCNPANYRIPLASTSDFYAMRPAPLPDAPVNPFREMVDTMKALNDNVDAMREETRALFASRPAPIYTQSYTSSTVTSVTPRAKRPDNCPICGEPLSGKQWTCSDACRMEKSRRDRGLVSR